MSTLSSLLMIAFGLYGLICVYLEWEMIKYHYDLTWRKKSVMLMMLMRLLAYVVMILYALCPN
jgi:hypothetical protein